MESKILGYDTTGKFIWNVLELELMGILTFFFNHCTFQKSDAVMKNASNVIQGEKEERY